LALRAKQSTKRLVGEVDQRVSAFEVHPTTVGPQASSPAKAAAHASGFGNQSHMTRVFVSAYDFAATTL
jgi:hypothetical protein